uniref:DnaJ_C domain-containing protein n=1 Tax=Steinernema glaseri TaxID=37863 RepID=A0A1I8ANU3_9BILA
PAILSAGAVRRSIGAPRPASRLRRNSARCTSVQLNLLPDQGQGDVLLLSQHHHRVQGIVVRILRSKLAPTVPHCVLLGLAKLNRSAAAEAAVHDGGARPQLECPVDQPLALLVTFSLGDEATQHGRVDLDFDPGDRRMRQVRKGGRRQRLQHLDVFIGQPQGFAALQTAMAQFMQHLVQHGMVQQIEGRAHEAAPHVNEWSTASAQSAAGRGESA